MKAKTLTNEQQKAINEAIGLQERLIYVVEKSIAESGIPKLQNSQSGYLDSQNKLLKALQDPNNSIRVDLAIRILRAERREKEKDLSIEDPSFAQIYSRKEFDEQFPTETVREYIEETNPGTLKYAADLQNKALALRPSTGRGYSEKDKEQAMALAIEIQKAKIERAESEGEVSVIIRALKKDLKALETPDNEKAKRIAVKILDKEQVGQFEILAARETILKMSEHEQSLRPLVPEPIIKPMLTSFEMTANTANKDKVDKVAQDNKVVQDNQLQVDKKDTGPNKDEPGKGTNLKT